MKVQIQEHINNSIETKTKLLQSSIIENIERSSKILVNALKNNKKILLCGNGGSAADAQHIAAELIIRFRSSNERSALPAISLSTDTSVLTACGNDYGFEFIFSRQIEGIGNEGDVLVAISTSGNSLNIIKAIEKAFEKKLKIIFLTGGNGGKILKEYHNYIDSYVCVPSYDTARIQESHIMIGHIFCEIIENELFYPDSTKI